VCRPDSAPAVLPLTNTILSAVLLLLLLFFTIIISGGGDGGIDITSVILLYSNRK